MLRYRSQAYCCIFQQGATANQAFKNTDGSIAVIVMNTTDKAIPYHVWIAGKVAATESMAHSISTLIIN